METWNSTSLQSTFGSNGPANSQTIGPGDTVQVVLWEAASGGLFSSSGADRVSSGSHSAIIPEQVVGGDGSIMVPYAGRIAAAGRTPRAVEDSIVAALQGKAIEPQALVTVTKNLSNTVSVLGEVTGGARVPLTVRGDRILDVIAAAGGTKSAPYDVFITLTRSGRSARVPMSAILANPGENIFVRAGDTVTVAREPQTFTAFGATGRNDVLQFEASSLTLDQAIARAGGLLDQRADARGVFVIRFEPVANYDQLALSRPAEGPLPEVSTIYRLDMRDPNSLFLAHRFPMRNKDVLFVSNAPATDLQKVGTIISTFLIPAGAIIGVTALARP
jgi:polysaccharide export outer membrane protein